jgi:hypothetical protein
MLGLCADDSKGRGFELPLRKLLWVWEGEDPITLLELSIVKRQFLVKLGRGPKNNYKILN